MHMKGCPKGKKNKRGVVVNVGITKFHIPYDGIVKICRVLTIVDSTYDNLIKRMLENTGIENFDDEYLYICKKIGYKGEPNDVKLLQYFVENEDLHDFWLL